MPDGSEVIWYFIFEENGREVKVAMEKHWKKIFLSFYLKQIFNKKMLFNNENVIIKIPR